MSFPKLRRSAGLDQGGLYAIQTRRLRGSPIKIGYSLNFLQCMIDWEDSCPEGVDIFAVAKMNGRSIHQGRCNSWPPEGGWPELWATQCRPSDGQPWGAARSP